MMSAGVILVRNLLTALVVASSLSLGTATWARQSQPTEQQQPSQAQTEPTPGEVPKRPPEDEAPQAIPIAEIAAKIEKSNAELREVRTRIEAVAAIAGIRDQLEPTSGLINEMSARREMANLDALPLQRLETLRLQWLRIDAQLEGWRDALQSRSKSLGVVEQELSAKEAVWDTTADAAPELQLPPELTEQILSVSRTITQLETERQSRLEEVLALQGRIAELRTQVGENLALLNSAMELARQRLFTIDSPALWEALLAPRPGVSLQRQARETWEADSEQFVDFLLNYRRRLIAQFLFFLALAVLMIVLSLRAKRWKFEETDTAMQAAVKVFSRPVSAALLMTLALTRTFHPRAPGLIYELNLLLALVPMLRLLVPLIYPHMRRALYGLSLLFLLDQLHALASEATLLQRLILVMITVATLGGLIWAARPGGPATAKVPSRWWGAAIFAARLATIPLVFSFVANVVGAVQLAELLTTGTLRAAYVAVALFALVLVVSGLFTVGMRAPFAQRLGSVRRHRELISRRLNSLLSVLAFVWWVWGVLRIFRIYDPVVAGLGAALGRQWTIGNLQISIGGIVAFFLAIYISVLLSRLLRFLLEEDVFPRVELPRGIKPTISMLVHYTLVALGVVVAVAAAGIPMSQFAIVAGALGVGIGFGLQNVVNNFVSGLILLFERPIKVGDTVEVGQLLGDVRRIGIRSSTVRTFDGAEVIVPNGNLISNEVVNWTLSDQLRRIEIPVGVAYGTDPQKVLDILVGVAREHEDALKYPEPFALFQGFGESSLDFLLRFWTANFDEWVQTRSEVTVRVNAALREAGIEIPFPQRDLHVRSVAPEAKGAMAAASAKQEPSPALETDPGEH